jgi:hypothetical protein
MSEYDLYNLAAPIRKDDAEEGIYNYDLFNLDSRITNLIKKYPDQASYI